LHLPALLPQPVLKAIAVIPILADVVEVKTGSRSTAHWSNDFIRLNRWLRNFFAQLIIPLDIDGIGQNWEYSNTSSTIVTRSCPPDAINQGCQRLVWFAKHERNST